MKNTLIITGIVILLLAGSVWWSKSLQKSDPDVVARNSLHWHPQVAIYIDGKKQEIPANIGIGVAHQPIHTHAEDATQGVIHMEFGSIVRTDDIRLGNFFTIWNKDMMNGFGTLTKMTVNGEENTEYENYVMYDKDKIELHYTTSPQSGALESNYQTMSVRELNNSLVNKDFTLVNVHIPYIAEIEGTDVFIPYNEIAQNFDQLPTDKNEKIVLYCQSGNMSAQAAQTLTNLGYTNIIDVPGGMIEWENQGYRLVQSR